MTMEEGPVQEPGYYFPGDKIQRYMDSLMNCNLIENYDVECGSRIVVMTHDDCFDPEMYMFEQLNGYSSTWFLDMHDMTPKDVENLPDDGSDLEIYFNKERSIQANTLEGQIQLFEDVLGRKPKYNRNHRLLWRSANMDFPFLAMHGITVDSTLIGTTPYYPVIAGKKIPILELPFSIADHTTRPMCIYNITNSIEKPFMAGQELIVVDAHPFSVCDRTGMKSCFYEVISHAERYGYRVMGIRELMEGVS